MHIKNLLINLSNLFKWGIVFNYMITVIGLGEIGLVTFKEINKVVKDVVGHDIDAKLIKSLQQDKLNVTFKFPKKSDIFIVSVYSSEQVIDVLTKIDYSNKPLIIIESTLKPGTIKQIRKMNLNCYLALCPHRYFKGDKYHQVFNLKRVLGGIDKPSIKKAYDFYLKFMDQSNITISDIELVEISKPLENAYRFVEIAIAEEIKLFCDKNNLNFNELKKMMNTKLNINVKEARTGIGGKCLPKDMNIINKLMKKNKIFKSAIKLDKKYKFQSK